MADNENQSMYPIWLCFVLALAKLDLFNKELSEPMVD